LDGTKRNSDPEHPQYTATGLALQGSVSTSFLPFVEFSASMLAKTKRK
jgi:hypothetical protein